MKKFDREDITLLVTTILLFILMAGFVIAGFVMFSNANKWDDFYLIATISSVVLFIFAFLSFIMKLRRK